MTDMVTVLPMPPINTNKTPRHVYFSERVGRSLLDLHRQTGLQYGRCIEVWMRAYELATDEQREAARCFKSNEPVSTT